jgi:hypothetical protein
MLKLAQLLGQLGVFLTWPLLSGMSTAGYFLVERAAKLDPGGGSAGLFGTRPIAAAPSSALRFCLISRCKLWCCVYSFAYFSSASLARFLRSNSAASSSFPSFLALDAGPILRNALFQWFLMLLSDRPTSTGRADNVSRNPYRGLRKANRVYPADAWLSQTTHFPILDAQKGNFPPPLPTTPPS